MTSFDEKRAELLRWLQTALELELATIPPYLVALLSIKPSQNRAAADRIRSVAIEEMLHLVLIANVINALGGTVRIDSHAVPTYPLRLTFDGKTFADRQVPIELAPFSPALIDTFMEVEKPASLIGIDLAAGGEIQVPSLTIGGFYTRIIEQIEELEAEAPGTLFIGAKSKQIEADFYWSSGGGIVIVTDLASATSALELVISQGEAAWPPSRARFAHSVSLPYGIGHYYRFAEIYHGRAYAQNDDPAGLPTGDPLSVDYGAVYPILANAHAADYPVGTKAADLNDGFNQQYTLMLRQIEEAMTGAPQTLYTAIMNGMHTLSSLARELMQTPLPDNDKGFTACPTFEWRV